MRSPRVLLAASVGALLLVAAACGDDDDGDSIPLSGNRPTTTTAPTTTTTVDVAPDADQAVDPEHDITADDAEPPGAAVNGDVPEEDADATSEP